MNLKAALLALFFLCFLNATAQKKVDFPQQYFRNPLDIPILLAGGFGECRPNHFHTGIDIKTNNQKNYRVYAAADGYIARISISSKGYGNCLYLAHPNGYTTVYAHLNRFFSKLQEWMIKEQYKQEKWAIQLFPKPGEFPVKKGQIIAWSGSTGGATGPHLHFEIRNTKTEQVLNEKLFGLPIKDTRAPKAQSIALYDGAKSIYMQSPKINELIHHGSNEYRTRTAIIDLSFSKIFIGIHAEDYMNDSHNWMGVYQMTLSMDGVLQAATLFRELDFSQARYANAYADYKTKKNKGIWYQGLYRLPNNELKVYSYMNSENGKLDIGDGEVHTIRIDMYDALGNHSSANFKIRYQEEKGETASQNTCEESQFWDCRKPHSYQDSTFRFQAGDHSFYDDICFKFEKRADSNGLTDRVQVLAVDIPVQEACQIALKLNFPLSNSLKSKIAFVHHVKPTRLPGNNPQSGMVGHYIGGWVTTAIKTLGNFYAVIDTVPPKIISYQKSGKYEAGKALRFKATDATTSVNTFNGFINGNWIRFVRKGDVYTYKIDNHCPKGKNILKIEAVDENNNVSRFTLNFDY